MQSWPLYLLTPVFRYFLFLLFRNPSTILSIILPITPVTLHSIYFILVLRNLESVFSSINLSTQAHGPGIFQALIMVICVSEALLKELEIL